MRNALRTKINKNENNWATRRGKNVTKKLYPEKRKARKEVGGKYKNRALVEKIGKEKVKKIDREGRKTNE